MLDPTKTQLSDSFLLSDFMGSSTIYSSGLRNVFEGDALDVRLVHAKALCEAVLEPILDTYGPLSVSYGFISPDVSRRTVKYQDADKPSYHRWDIGAAADILVHEVCGQEIDAFHTSPAYLSHHLDRKLCLPFSRMLTYSESPYICIAANAFEVQGTSRGEDTRRALYENRYTGKAKVKPRYIKMESEGSRLRTFNEFKEAWAKGAITTWKGAGYPTYHGGGRKQLHHVRTSKYTMLTDWLFDLNSISNGQRNLPSMTNKKVADAFVAAGRVYDRILMCSGYERLSIVEGYLSHLSKYSRSSDPRRDWRNETIMFAVSALTVNLREGLVEKGVRVEKDGDKYVIELEVSHVLRSSW